MVRSSGDSTGGRNEMKPLLNQTRPMLLAIIHQRGCSGLLRYALYRYAAYVMNYTTKQQGRLFI